MSDYLPPISFPTGVVIQNIFRAKNFNAIVSNLGSIYLFGFNTYGQLVFISSLLFHIKYNRE